MIRLSYSAIQRKKSDFEYSPTSSYLRTLPEIKCVPKYAGYLKENSLFSEPSWRKELLSWA